MPLRAILSAMLSAPYLMIAKEGIRGVLYMYPPPTRTTELVCTPCPHETADCAERAVAVRHLRADVVRIIGRPAASPALPGANEVL
jgi:hypothetical protein